MALSPADQLWSRIPIEGDAAPARVLAAAIRAEDEQLYVVDRVAGSTRTRLLRIDAIYGNVAVIGGWHPRFSAPWDVYRLAPTPDGELVVLASNQTSNRWEAVLCGVQGAQLVPLASATGVGRITGGARAGDIGVSFAVQSPGGAVAVTGVRYLDFRPVATGPSGR